MATPNPDSATTGIPVTMRFSNPGGCIPPQVEEALGVSTLGDNVARLDSQGKIYVPGVQIVELAQQTVIMGTTVPPGQPVDLTFTPQQISDLNLTLINENLVYEPAGAPVNKQGPFVNSGAIRYTFYRQSTADTPPYDEIVIRMSLRAFVYPSPNPA